MMKANRIAALCSLTVLISILSCEKDKENGSDSNNYRIKSIQININEETHFAHFTYDDTGNILEISYEGDGFKGDKHKYTYSDSLIFDKEVISESTNTWSLRHFVILNSNGTIREVVSSYNSEDPIITDHQFIQSNGFPEKEIVYNGGNSFSKLYHWDNRGNLLRIAEEEENGLKDKGSFFTYYTDKEYKPERVSAFTRSLSTAQGFDQIFNYGAPVYYTSHLVKTFKASSGAMTYYGYEFDRNGRIVKSTSTSDYGYTTILTYEYEFF